MLSFMSNVLSHATRLDHWTGPAHLRQGSRQKPGWEIERDLAEERARIVRRPGIF